MISNRWQLIISASISLVLIFGTALRLNATASEHRVETTRLRTLQADIEKLERLRATDANALIGEPPEDDLLSSVRGIIRDVGLPSAAFARLSTSGESSVRGREGYSRKSYRLELNGLDATDLGSFLGRWRDAEPLWTVESIELRRQQPNRRVRDRSHAAYSVSLTLSTVFANGLGHGGSR